MTERMLGGLHHGFEGGRGEKRAVGGIFLLHMYCMTCLHWLGFMLLFGSILVFRYSNGIFLHGINACTYEALWFVTERGSRYESS